MPLSQKHIDASTPLGTALVDGGATFRLWAPAALEVHVRLPDDGTTAWTPSAATRLQRAADGTWGGFVPGAKDGDIYRFFVRGRGSDGFKRDPLARELTREWPDARCVLRDPSSYPWHDRDFRTPAFNDLVLYQFHFGTWYARDDHGGDRRKGRVAKFLDAVDLLPHLAGLGFNAVQPLPVVEFSGTFSLGYNGVDYFSPEMDYAVEEAELPRYLEKVNQLLADKGQRPLSLRALTPHGNQLKAFIDLCHLYGIAVILDVVYNHAGGDFGDEGIYFLDRQEAGDLNRSLYFTDQGWAGGLVFAYWNADVRRFLIENGRFWLEEYHADGLRYDEVSVIAEKGGWEFCQQITDALHGRAPEKIHLAEYWRHDPYYVVRATREGGAGFDAHVDDRLRGAVRRALSQAAGGASCHVSMTDVGGALRPDARKAAWRSIQHLENHDLVLISHDDRMPRLAALADGSDARSWYARSRARVAHGLLLTAPGIPMMFMGQEMLEAKPWHDDPNDEACFVDWDGLAGDPVVRDHVRFVKDLLTLRRRTPALRGECANPFHIHDDNRVLACHRWIEGRGRDLIVVASLNEHTFHGYRLGFPRAGRWREVLNSDAYDNYSPTGNHGQIFAEAVPMHGLSASAAIAIPANSLLVFAWE